MVYVTAGGALVQIGTLIRVATGPAKGYDPARHSTWALRLGPNLVPGERPKEAGGGAEPSGEPFFQRLIAAGAALAPAYIFGATPTYAGWAFLAAGAAVAALPPLPRRTPAWLRVAPGALLGLAGLAAAASGAAPMALAAVLAGWGLAALAARRTGPSDPEFVGAFYGTLGVLAALGAEVSGLGGWLGTGLRGAGFLAAGTMMVHLPGWFWAGAQAVILGFDRSSSRIDGAVSFWREDTDFLRNVRRWWRSWGEIGAWNGRWLWPALGAYYVLMAAYDFALSAVMGPSLGLIRAPVHFAWGAAYSVSPRSPLTRFIGGFARSWLDNSEGARPLFDRWMAPLARHIDGAAGDGRPTARAVASLGLARLVQLAWLARIVLWSPVILTRAVIDGVRAAGEGAPPDGHSDPLDPGGL